MPELTASFIQDAVGWYESVLPTLKIASLIITGLLAYGIVYFLLKSGWHYWKADQWADQAMREDLPQRRARRAWREAVRLIQNPADRAAWITALQKADDIVLDGLKIKKQEEVEDADARDARILFRDASQDPDFPLTHEGAINALRAYKKGIRELGMF